MSNLIQFRKPSDPSFIHGLEDLIKSANNGEIIQCIIVAEMRENNKAETYCLRIKHLTKAGNFFMLLGMLQSAMLDLRDWYDGL